MAIEKRLQDDDHWPVLTSTFRSAASPTTVAHCTAEIIVEREERYGSDFVLKGLLIDEQKHSSDVISLDNSLSNYIDAQSPESHNDMSSLYNTPDQFSQISMDHVETASLKDCCIDLCNGVPSPDRSKSHTNTPQNFPKLNKDVAINRKANGKGDFEFPARLSFRDDYNFQFNLFSRDAPTRATNPFTNRDYYGWSTNSVGGEAVKSIGVPNGSTVQSSPLNGEESPCLFKDVSTFNAHGSDSQRNPVFEENDIFRNGTLEMEDFEKR